jgi:hypothetical protein
MRRALTTLTAATMTTLAVIGATAGSATSLPVAPRAAMGETGIVFGPPYEFTTALIDGRQVGKPLTGVAVINRTEHGYVYRAGSQDNHLVVTRVKRGLRFADSGTPRFRHLAPSCRKVEARRGVAAVCRLPRLITEQQPLLVEVWPRIGDDFLDTSGLSAQFAVTMLGDLGVDVARFGPGPDFFNGHTAHDRAYGGGGNDWIRAGDDADTIFGGPGHDYLVGMDGDDVIHGGDGDDLLVGMDGDDRLLPEAGLDVAQCGAGVDSATADVEDSVRQCESVTLP